MSRESELARPFAQDCCGRTDLDGQVEHETERTLLVAKLPEGELRARQRMHFDALTLLGVFIQHGDLVAAVVLAPLVAHAYASVWPRR